MLYPSQDKLESLFQEAKKVNQIIGRNETVVFAGNFMTANPETTVSELLNAMAEWARKD